MICKSTSLKILNRPEKANVQEVFVGFFSSATEQLKQFSILVILWW